MEITQERKQELVEMLLNSTNALDKEELSFSKAPLRRGEANFIKESLGKFLPLIETDDSLIVRDLNTALKDARKDHPELNKEIGKSVQQKLSFVEKNVGFLAIGGILGTPVAVLSTLALSNPGSSMTPVIGASLLGLAALTTAGASLIKESPVDVSKRTKVELRTLLHNAFDLNSSKENIFEVKDKAEDIVNKFRNTIGESYKKQKLAR